MTKVLVGDLMQSYGEEPRQGARGGILGLLFLEIVSKELAQKGSKETKDK